MLKLFINVLKKLSWLTLQPSAWHRYVNRLSLPADFCLSELNRQSFSRERHQLLVQEFIGLPMLVSACVALLLAVLNVPWPDLTFGVCVAVSATLGTAVSSSLTVGVAASWGASAAAGLASGLIFGCMGVESFLTFRTDLAVQNTQLMQIVAAAVPPVFMASFPNGVGAGIVLSLDTSHPRYSINQTLSGIVLGVLGSGLLLSGGSHLSEQFTQRVANHFPSAVTTHSAVFNQVIFSTALGIVLGLLIARHTRRWKRELAMGILLGMSLPWLIGLGANSANPVFRGLAIGGGNSLLLTMLFAFAYNLAAAIAGGRAGAIAGVIGSSSLHTLFISLLTGAPILSTLSLSAVFTLLGLTLPFWLPVLLYPIETLWNTILCYVLEKSDKRAIVTQSLHQSLHWHSAFWDQRQRIPLWGLDQALVMLSHHDASEFQAAQDTLSKSFQQWAVHAAQHTLDIQQLARCRSVQDICAIHHQPLLSPRHGSGSLHGSAASILLSFRQISSDAQAILNQTNRYSQRMMLTALHAQLSTLLQELTHSGRKSVIRFQPILQRWQHILHAYQQELIEETALNQTIDSPYIVGIPLTPQQTIFVGRQDLSAKIEQILNQQRHTSLLLYGQRRMGKTSLLNNLSRLLPSHIIPLFVDLQGPAGQASTHAGFLYGFARDICRSAQKHRQISFPSLSREVLEADPFSAFDEWLDQVEQVAGDRTLLLSLDEFEALDRAFTTNRLSEPAILGMLRHLIQHRPQIKVLLSGSHTLTEFQHWSSYLINLQVLHISYLTTSEARNLIESPARDFPLRYDPAATERILTLTRGHPFLIQLLCSEIIALKNTQPRSSRRHVSPADVTAAIPHA
ncbi:MAG: AAA family ATPase, partial [Cyanobacteria bacterium J06632_3]